MTTMLREKTTIASKELEWAGYLNQLAAKRVDRRSVKPCGPDRPVVTVEPKGVVL